MGTGRARGNKRFVSTLLAGGALLDGHGLVGIQQISSKCPRDLVQELAARQAGSFVEEEE